jgi:predicted RND superfamily exporter protein
MRRPVHVRIYDALVRRRFAVPAVALVVVIATSSGMPLQKMDMSFKPFFVDSNDESVATESYERAFGPIDQTHVGVVVEYGEPLSQPVVRHVRALSDAFESLPGVTEVVSITHLEVPQWTGTKTAVQRALPPAVIADETACERALGALADHPAVKRSLVSADGTKVLILIRMHRSLRDTESRAPLLSAVRDTAEDHCAPGIGYRIVGSSVVEDAYADIVQRNLSMSLGLNLVAMTVVLLVLFRSVPYVAVALSGLAVATPMTLGIMHFIGQPITIINSMVSTMAMIIGLADAIHMLRCFQRNRSAGKDVAGAVRAMFGEMAEPCFLTTLTTALGFLSLGMASMAAIRDFGLNVAIGVAIVYVANLVAIPMLLLAMPAGWLPGARQDGRGWLDRRIGRLTRRVIASPWLFVTAAALVTAAGIYFIPRLEVNQYYNEDVAADHPVRRNQALVEEEFGGYLGPVVSVRSISGASLASPEVIRHVRAFQDAVGAREEVLGVRSFIDYLPAGMPLENARQAMNTLRADGRLAAQVKELANDDLSWIGIRIRTVDMGIARAKDFGPEIASLAREHLGAAVEAELVGQWWLSQGGMRNLLGDMLASFALSCALVLLVLAFVVHDVRLFIVGVLPNVLPMVLALGFMAAAGITVRIGTAMVLAIALGIAIDDTIHFLVGMRERMADGAAARDAVRWTMRRAGGGIVYSSIVLVLGFASMMLNEMLAIQDMGLVASVTLTVALLADVVLAPALYLVLFGRSRRAQATCEVAKATA